MIARPHLLRRLDAWSDVTVICGMVGSGKSTLAAMWAESATSLFWCAPEHGRLPFDEISEFAERGAGVLVIENAEGVDDGEYVRLGRLIDYSPKLRVIVTTTRSRTAERLSQETAAALDIITARELSFTLEELRDAGVLASDSEREAMLRQSDGFAVAVREEIEAARQGVSGARDRFRHQLHEALNRQPGRHEAALWLALLPRVDQDILDSWQLPSALLHELEQAGVVQWKDNWLSLHRYVRELLLEDAERLVPVEERDRLITDAVHASLIDKDPLEALRAAFIVNDLELATEVVFSSMIELLETRDETYAVFTAVPAAKLRGHPVLTVMLVLLSNIDPQTRPRALQLLATESVFQRLQPGRGTYRERVVYRVFEAVALRLSPVSVSALPLIRRAFEDLVELREEDVATLGRLGTMLYVHLGISAFYLRDYALAQHCFELADVQHAEAGRNDRVDTLSLRGGFAALSGELRTARRLLDEADRATWPTGWRESSPADFFNLGQAVLAVEEGEPLRADTYIQAAGPIEEILEHWAVFALVRARRDRLAGEPQLGLVRLRKLRETRVLAVGPPLARSFLDAAEAELLLAVGELDAARRIAARSAKHSATCRIVLARVELALGRASAAARQAHTVLKDPRTLGRSVLEAEIVLLCVASRNGLDRDVRVIAERVAEHLTETGLRDALRTIAAQDRDPVKNALHHAGVDGAIISLIGADHAEDDHSGVQVIALTVREQAVLEVLAETPALDEIAERLFVSRNTVKSQVASIYRKLGVSSREAALTRAAVLGLLV